MKLNGGLGTGMGLDKAKSLLEVKDGETFLDITAKQVLNFRKKTGMEVKFMLMNSFSTSEDTVCASFDFPDFHFDEPIHVRLISSKSTLKLTILNFFKTKCPKLMRKRLHLHDGTRTHTTSGQ